MFAKSDYLQNGRSQTIAALGVTSVVVLLWLFMPMAVLPLAISVILIALIAAVHRPFAVCLILILFAFFKLDETFPVLAPLRLTLFFSVLVIFALTWNVLISRSIEPFWPPELKAFFVFLLIVTLGVPFAKSSRQIAFDEWWSFSKIALLIPAIAWIPVTPRHFEVAARAFIVGGILIGLVAIYNKYTGIALVEGTRVTIGRGFLANPNDLALLLLFPLSFAAALLVHRSSAITTAAGLIGLPTIIWTIILTQSRGGFLGVMAVFFLIGLRIMKSKFLLCCLGLGAAFALYAAMEISDRVQGGTDDVDQASAMMRIYAWQAAVNMAASWPLTGAGIGNFTTQYPLFAPDLTNLYVSAHSIWFQVLGDTGLPGFVAFAIMVIVGFAASLRNLRSLTLAGAPSALQGVALALLAGLAGFCVSGSFASHAYTWPLYILLGFTAALSRYRVMEATTSTSHGRRGDASENPRLI